MNAHWIVVAAYSSVASLLQAQSESNTLEQVRTWLSKPSSARESELPDVNLTKQAAHEVTAMVYARLRDEALRDRANELKATDGKRSKPTRLLTVKVAGKDMKVYERTFGDAPKEGHSLWISMHGGGGAPARVNDGQWNNQIELYQPKEGIYVAPRAPTNTWNLWHEGHIDDLFDRLIENYVIERGVNPNRVYLMGYSAGGDGVYQLAPRMADRFAAASMMAGHPNGVPVDSLRNLPFMIWMGEKDGAYNRNEQAASYGKTLDKLAEANPGGYVHETHIVANKGHWMDREDRAALPWMAKYTRNPWPKQIVWRQSGRVHNRFYWLAMPNGAAKGGQTVRASVQDQQITIASQDVASLALRLNDALIDLEQPIKITWNGATQTVTPTRSLRAIYESLKQRLDPSSAATATVKLGE